MDPFLHALSRAVYRFLLLCTLFVFSGAACAATLTVPATSSTGSFRISWTGSWSGYVYLYENTATGPVRLKQSSPNDYYDVTGKNNGTYAYYLEDCQPNYNAPHTCTTSPVKYVTVTIPAQYTGPAAPSSVSASASGTTATVSWTGVAAATSYNVMRNGIMRGTVSSTSYTDTGLANGTYTYSVQSCNANGCSGTTAAGSITISPPPVPAAPSSVTASVSGTSASVNWASVSGATYYAVQRTFSMVAPTNVSGNSHTDSSLSAGVSYTWDVQACNASGCSSATRSNSVTTAAPAPATPGGVTASAASGSITVRWNAVSGASSYTILKSYSGTSTTLSAGSGTSYTDTSVSAGTTYTYSVRACNGSGCSSYSAGASATPPVAVPAAPTGLNGTASNTSIALGWNAVSGATYYSLQRSPTGAAFPVNSITSPSYTDSGLAQGTSYTYTLRACNGSGCSASAASVTVATPAATTIPAAPATLSATQAASTIRLSWSAASNATVYKLRRTNGAAVTALADASGTSATDSSVAVDTDYTYQVQACNSAGCSGWTSAASIRVPHIPAPPTSVGAVVRKDMIVVSWPNNDNATSARLTRNGTQVSAAAASPYSDTSVVNNTAYTYGVSACNLTGCSAVVSSPTVTAGVLQAGAPAVEGYGYDALGRLIKVTAGAALKTEYKYDNAGNRKQVNE